VSVGSGEETATIAPEELLRVRWQREPADVSPSSILVQLVDGARFPASSFEVINRQATIRAALAAEPIEIGAEQIAWVAFPREGVELPPLVEQLEHPSAEGDLLAVFNKKTEQADVLSGVIQDVTADEVSFRWEGDTIPVRRNKVVGLAYYHAVQSPTPEPKFWITTSHGAHLPIERFEPVGEQVLLTTPLGLKFRLDAAVITMADYSAGKLVMLSELEPLRERWTPLVGLPVAAEVIQQYGKPRRDQSQSGSRLALLWPAEESFGAGELRYYDSGLAVRSRTELIYRVPPGMNRFATLAGIDPECVAEGNVELRITADDRVLWQGEVAGNMAPIDVNIQLDGAERLTILVDYGLNLDFGDRLNLVDARFSK
jgi:hypothetical protein